MLIGTNPAKRVSYDFQAVVIGEAQLKVVHEYNVVVAVEGMVDGCEAELSMSHVFRDDLLRRLRLNPSPSGQRSRQTQPFST